MEVSFVETMRGTLVTADGERTEVEFDVVARAPSVRTLLFTGRTELTGLLRAPPFASEVPARGSLVLGPTALDYELHFTAADGRALVLNGHKGPSLLKPVTSMTVMAAVLRDPEGNEVARGEMRFDLKDLVPFLASWLPVGRFAQRALDTRRRRVERHLLEEA